MLNAEEHVAAPGGAGGDIAVSSAEADPATAKPSRRWTLLIGLAVLAVMTAVAVFWYLTLPQVTDVLGKTADRAIAALEADGFTVAEIVYDEDADGEQGSVIAQEPTAGKRAKDGTSVLIVVAGPPPVPVPDLSGTDTAGAEASLVAVGLALGNVTESYHDAVPAGLVISQDFEVGADAPVGSKIDIVISKGREPVAVASVVGAQQGDAVTALQTAGFTVTIVPQDNAAPQGTVLDQSPAAGTMMVPGTAVTLTVSTGVDLVRVPNARDFQNDGTYNGDDWGKILADIKAAIEAGFRRAGLTANVEFLNAWESGDSYRQNPKPGTMVPRGTRVYVGVPVYD